MIEVFKTDVSNRADADLILQEIKSQFPEFIASFDLEDCDKILRVENNGKAGVEAVYQVVKDAGFQIEILPDTVPQ
jgi:hypothetical protein